MNAPRCFVISALVTLGWLGCGRDPLLEPGLMGGRGAPGAGGASGTGAGSGASAGRGGGSGGRPTDGGADRRDPTPDFRPGEVAIVIVPGNAPPLPIGQSLQLRALVDLGGLRDITRDPELVWRVEDPGIALVAERSGRLTAVAAGTTTVHASHAGLGAGSAQVAVTAVAVRELQVSPDQVQLAVGQNEQLQARAVYLDGTEAEVTEAAGWLSSDQRIVRVGTGVEPIGRVIGALMGETVVSAEFAGKRSQVAILVSGGDGPTLSVAPTTGRGMVGATVAFQAFARRAAGAAIDVSMQSSWSSSGPSVAASLGGGRFRCTTAGSVTVTASYFSASSAASLECGGGPAQVQELRLTSANSDFFVGLTYRLSVQAFFADGSPPRELMNNQVRWTSSDQAVAGIDAAGLLSARAAGQVVISATLGNVTGQETYTIKAR
jgi:trimeric autotransporter adhesin